MIKVLHKGFDILEFLAQTPGKPRPLADIAGQLKMHPATCANIIQTMVRRNYAEQIAPKKGYLLGPALFQITRNGPYRKDLVASAEPQMIKLAKTVNETVLLATLRLGRRFILSQINGQQQIQVSAQALFQDNVYDTATGRLLLAYSPEHELEKVISEQGLPGKRWPEVKSLTAFKNVLVEIRKKGWVCHFTNEELVGLAFPVWGRENQVIAALGMFLPRFRFKGAHKNAIMKGMSATASAISKYLSLNAF